MNRSDQRVPGVQESQISKEELASTQRRRKRGILDAGKIRFAAFFIITICLIFIVGGAILVIWDFAEPDLAWRTVTTCLVIAAGTAVFAAVNGAFGSYAEQDEAE